MVELHLDMQKQKYDQLNTIITGRVGDNESNVVDVYITKENEPYSLIDMNIFYECLKPDKTTIRDTYGVKMIDAKNGRFTYTFPTEVFSKSGNISLSFFAIEKDKEFRATTQNFSVVSLQNALDGNAPSSDYISDLEKLINQANELIEHIKELEQKAIDIVDEELQIIRDHVNEMLEEIETSVEAFKESIENKVKELELLVQGLDNKLIQLDKDIQAMIEAVKNGGALKLDGSNAMTGTINSTAQTPFQFRDAVGVWHRQTIDSGYWFQTRDPLIFSGISTFEGPGVNFKHKFLRLKNKDVLVDGAIEDYFGLWSLTEQSLQHNEKDILSIDEKTGDIKTSGNLVQPTDIDWMNLPSSGVEVVPDRPLKYKKVGGIVTIMGSIRNTKNVEIFATIPEKIRPPQDIAFPLVVVGSPASNPEFTIQKGGGMFVNSIPTGATCHLVASYLV
ncbi:BppU family phage baseplate upper protein [Bacillus cereus]|uniref:BppU N-terminal domain-containing protein n=1 Tax=Bacillus cereus TaxID=1396 RepID=A0A9X7BG31_BACCE|nr:BppU family phage baseplate upper protein [Bacillus cereus]PED41973.1 hypothetical protein CON26_20925 [Bacillus cereus]PFV11210.1 hypothetical protein COK98_02770 [Bacillus cereus]